jgi:ketosteroid isomerase-like protein
VSQENVELARRGTDALSRHDFEAVAEVMDPLIEWNGQRELPGAASHHGVEAVLRHLRATFEDMADFRVEGQQFVEAGDYVVVTSRVRAKGRASGAPVERVTFSVNEYRAGRLVRVSIYATKAEPLAAVGLEE